MVMVNRIIVVGSTGLIGRSLSKFLLSPGNEIVSVSRDPESARNLIPGLRSYEKLQINAEKFREIVDGSDVVINMTGSPAFEKYRDYDRIVRESRVDLTESISEGISQCERKPKVFINASASGYYGPGGPDQTYTETSAGGDDYWGNLVKDWEAATGKAEKAGVRTVKI